MKDQAMEQFKVAQDAAAGALYDAGFADGVASVAVGGISADQEKADIAAAVAVVQADLQVQLDALMAQVASDVSALQACKDLETALQAKLDQIKALVGA